MGGGWSLNEITSVRRADESISLHTGYSDPGQLSYGVARARNGFRPRRLEASEDDPAQVSERIAMASTMDSVEPR